ncbi:UNVERIFIED_CONTAM: hypothetical protein PYX00_006039 [Menopon gallinae]|uniref:Uncharacterized protein n=1 Tax=Menopon gallinae TaxID=328185 RepID=A0AAW2HTK9_9NEOP
MIEGSGRHVDEAWPDEDNRKMNVSMMDVSSRNWGVYNEQQEADSLNDPTSLNEPISSPESLGTRKLQKRFASGKNFFGHFMTSRGTTPTVEMLDYKEPFSQFWMVLSTLYGQALIIIMLAFCLTEVMDNPVKMLTLQGIFLMYLYVGSIAVIICIYIWVLVDSCSSLNSSDAAGLVPPTITTSIVPDRERELRSMSVTKFGSLKKAHISRDRTSSTSFYLRIGAIAFGLGTLVFNGLEMAMHSMMEGSCLNDVVFVHPILHGLFTFLQMHFLFVNSQVLVERFGLAARFGFMHLTATNLALWIRLIIWESGNEWTYFVHLSQTTKAGIHSSSEIPTPLQLRGFPKFVTRKERDIGFTEVSSSAYQPISDDHISQVVSLHHCLNTNSLGQLWTSSMPFLYPFIIQFSLIAAAVTFVMGQKVAKDRLFFQKQKKAGMIDNKTAALPTIYDNIGSWGVDCNRASKGLFLGLLCLVVGVVVIIIFLVVKEDEDFPTDTIFWLTNGTLLVILSIAIFMNVIGLAQIRKLSVIGRKMTKLDNILSVISMLGVQLYGTFGILVGAVGLALDDSSDSHFLTSNQKRHAMLLFLSVAQILQATMQSSLISEGIRRTSLTRNQILTKPARQIITFLLFSNAVLWAFDTFVVHSWMSQELQLRFYGVLVWGVISRIGLPLLVFFRFHSCVLLLEIWKRSYQSLHIDPGN